MRRSGRPMMNMTCDSSGYLTISTGRPSGRRIVNGSSLCVGGHRWSLSACSSRSGDSLRWISVYGRPARNARGCSHGFASPTASRPTMIADVRGAVLADQVGDGVLAHRGREHARVVADHPVRHVPAVRQSHDPDPAAVGNAALARPSRRREAGRRRRARPRRRRLTGRTSRRSSSSRGGCTTGRGSPASASASISSQGIGGNDAFGPPWTTSTAGPRRAPSRPGSVHASMAWPSGCGIADALGRPPERPEPAAAVAGERPQRSVLHGVDLGGAADGGGGRQPSAAGPDRGDDDVVPRRQLLSDRRARRSTGGPPRAETGATSVRSSSHRGSSCANASRSIRSP